MVQVPVNLETCEVSRGRQAGPSVLSTAGGTLPSCCLCLGGFPLPCKRGNCRTFLTTCTGFLTIRGVGWHQNPELQLQKYPHMGSLFIPTRLMDTRLNTP